MWSITLLLQQVKFYRVDIDEDNIAATVAEAGVASVVLALLRLLHFYRNMQGEALAFWPSLLQVTGCSTTYTLQCITCTCSGC